MVVLMAVHLTTTSNDLVTVRHPISGPCLQDRPSDNEENGFILAEINPLLSGHLSTRGHQVIVML